MNREEYVTSLVRQSNKATEVTKALYKSAEEALAKIDMAQYKNVNKIYITGCGDSYCAAVITKPIFEQLSDPQNNPDAAAAFELAPPGPSTWGLRRPKRLCIWRNLPA